jgi:hypothetical protein
MSWLSEAHEEWHLVNGKYACCPLDCGASEALYDQHEAEEWARTHPEEVAKAKASLEALEREREAALSDPWQEDPPF